MFSKTGEIRRDDACVDFAGTEVILYPCHGSKGNQFWEYENEVQLDLISRLDSSTTGLIFAIYDVF